MLKKKIFTTAPLPFQGQKRKFLKQFKPALAQYSETATYVDLFGGSGLLSHTVKSIYPNALEKETLYNTVRQSAYDANGYLDGIEVVTIDYKHLFAKYKDLPNVVFLVDPPYLSTDSGTYKNVWKLKDYLDVLQVLDGTNYFYFTSNKSSIIELCEWIETKTPMSNPFTGALTETMNASVTYSASYTDIMIYKYE